MSIYLQHETPRERRARESWRAYHEREYRKRHGIPEPQSALARVCTNVMAWAILLAVVGLVCLVFPSAFPIVLTIGIFAAIGHAMDKDRERERRESEDRIVRRIAKLQRRP